MTTTSGPGRRDRAGQHGLGHGDQPGQGRVRGRRDGSCRRCIGDSMRSREGKLGVAVVGLGWWGQAVVRALEGSESMQVVTTVGTPSRVRRYGARPRRRLHHATTTSCSATRRWRRSSCARRTRCTREQIARAARAGKHVYCEKPLALKRREALASVEICTANGVRPRRRSRASLQAAGARARAHD